MKPPLHGACSEETRTRYAPGVGRGTQAVGASAEAPETTATPSVDAYLRGLPDGWCSYPECRADGALLGSLRASGSLDGIDALPDALARHLLPGAERWIPEVAHVAILLAIRDRRFAGPRGEAAFVAWLQRLNSDLLPDRSDVGPDVAVHGFPDLWASLHRGTFVEVLEAGPRHALLAAVHPEPIFPPLAMRWRRDAVVGYLARAGAVQPRATELGRVHGKTHIGVRWK